MIHIAFADDESMIAIEYRRSRTSGRRVRTIKRALRRTTPGPVQESGESLSPRELVALLADSCSDFEPRTYRHGR